MGLKIRRFEYRNFRNYNHYVLDDISDLTLFIGPNAVGKTNLIEGVELLTALTSFRNPKSDHLVTLGETASYLTATLTDGDRLLEIKLVINQGKKEYFLNGKKKQTRSLRGILPSVFFCPDDLSFIKGSQSIKRSQIDLLGSQLSANYDSVRKDYEKIVRQKNRYLKEVVSHDYLQSINDVLITIGAQLYTLRSQLVAELIPYIRNYYHELSGRMEKVDIAYIPSWKKYDVDTESFTDIPFYSKEQARECLEAVLHNEHSREHERRRSLFGPHADKIEFYIEGRNADSFASQGQQRSLVLSYKMAEIALIRDKLNQDPILLLDDVMSELDGQRRRELVRLISHNTQTFITSTNLSYFEKEFLDHATIVMLDRN